MIQLNMFPEETNLQNKIEKLEKQMDTLRKSLFAREAEIRRLHMDTAHRLQILELNICKGRLL